jgi:hypothetical protein
MISVNHRERQIMQYLRARAWVSAASLPSSPKVFKGLIDKAWIEARGQGPDLCYRITDKGLAAKKVPIRIYS